MIVKDAHLLMHPVQGGLDDITDRTEGEESSGYKIPQSLTDLQKRGRALGKTLISGREEESKLEAQMKDLIEKRTRPTLSYADLIRESEAEYWLHNWLT